MSFKVVLTDTDTPPADIEREELAGLDVDLVELYSFDEDEILEACRDADAVLVQYAKITRRIIEALEKCRIISRYGVGLDMVDLEAATECGIPVAYVPDYCVDEVSDHAMALLLALYRKLLILDPFARQGGGDARPLVKPIFGLRGQALGLVGIGRIGRAMVPKAQGFGLRVLAYDPYVTSEAIREMGAEPASFEKLLRESDFISLHLPLTSSTKHIMGEEQFRAVKPTAGLINVSRGGLIDERALYTALMEGRIGSAALDVMEEVSPSPDTPLFSLNNAIFTPHMAYYSERALDAVRRGTVQEVARVLRGEQPINLANPQVKV
jgi:D-3-phosphoglycerate dehydrogenase